MKVPADYAPIEQAITTINTKPYFLDRAEELVGADLLEQFKLRMGLYTIAGGRNMLLVGGRGSGKTTYASVMASLATGLPYDLFDSLKIQGNPDNTKDTMLARVDLGRIAEEGVVWQPTLFLPVVICDELNRNPSSKQNTLLEYVRTGVVEHLGRVFLRDKPAFFATINYNGDGTYPLTPPMLDRFDISFEFLPGSSMLQYKMLAAKDNIARDLSDRTETKRILKDLLDKETSYEERLRKITDHGNRLRTMRAEFKGLAPALEKLAVNAVRMQRDRSRMDTSALGFLRCAWEELNTTYTYGTNRSVDPLDPNTHNEKFASHKVKEGVSERWRDSVTFYAAMLATNMGSSKISIDHLLAVAPHCSAHRLEFQQDYKAQFTDTTRLRGEREELDLSRHLLDEVKQNWDAISGPLGTLDQCADGKLNPADKAVAEILTNPVAPDHPLLREYWRALRARHKIADAGRTTA